MQMDLSKGAEENVTYRALSPTAATVRPWPVYAKPISYGTSATLAEYWQPR